MGRSAGDAGAGTGFRSPYRTSSPRFQWSRLSRHRSLDPMENFLRSDAIESPGSRPATTELLATLPGTRIHALHRLQPGWKLLSRGSGLPQRGGESKTGTRSGTSFVKTMQGEQDGIGLIVAWNCNRKLMTSGSYARKMVKLWDVAAERNFATFEDQHPCGVCGCISPDGSGWLRISRTGDEKIRDVLPPANACTRWAMHRTV